MCRNAYSGRRVRVLGDLAQYYARELLNCSQQLASCRQPSWAWPADDKNVSPRPVLQIDTYPAHYPDLGLDVVVRRVRCCGIKSRPTGSSARSAGRTHLGGVARCRYEGLLSCALLTVIMYLKVKLSQESPLDLRVTRISDRIK
jgi:hypothetical protein